MPHAHPQLASGRWFTLSLAEQLGNVGSEYERACTFQAISDGLRFQQAFERFLELLDLTIADPRWRNYRLKELCRLREQACEEFLGTQHSDLGSLKNYFLTFAVAARSA